MTTPANDAKRLLIVEDDTVIASVYRRQFQHAGLAIELVGNGEDAIESLKARRPDLVVLDLMLPKINGIDVLRFIRGQATTADVPVVVFSNAYLNRHVEAAWKAGATKCLTKAFCSFKQLLEVVREELDARPVRRPGSEPDAAPRAPGQMQDPGVAAQIRQAFFDRAALTTTAMRTLLKTFLRVEGDPSAIRPTEEGIKTLAELYRATHNVTGEAGMAGFARIAGMAAALEAFLKELLDSPKKITPSATRTVAQSVDFLCYLFEHAHADGPESGEAPSILVVDDENTSRKAVLAGLEKAHLKATAVADGLTALELATDYQYDVIFLDVDMPGMDGFRLCSRLRALPRHAKTPVIFVTILSDFQNRARSVMSGGTDLIAKPFLLMELAVKAMTYVIKNRMNPPVK